MEQINWAPEHSAALREISRPGHVLFGNCRRYQSEFRPPIPGMPRSARQAPWARRPDQIANTAAREVAAGGAPQSRPTESLPSPNSPALAEAGARKG